MFYEFSHRHSDCTIDEEFRYGEGVIYGQGLEYSGANEKVILSRDSKGTSLIQREYAYNGLFAPVSVVKQGALVKVEDSYFVITMRKTAEGNKSCSMMKTNCIVELQRFSQTYDANDNPVSGTHFNQVQVHVIAYAEYVNASLRQQEIGLLPTTEYILYLHPSADIKRPQEVLSPDRVIIKGRPYQVDGVDDVKLPNMLYVQLSEDKR
ncbi:MAG: hypothetical protein K0Q73_7505 [Paenibacillus sp.]|nr:hypothetical protein [Paenibacillus sp.]